MGQPVPCTRLAAGDWPFRYRTMLAPMEGVTHPELRTLLSERGGIGVVCTEFVRISRAPLNPRVLRREVVKSPGVPLSVQVMGNEPEKMAEAAAVVEQAGADVVDVNLGCPAPRAVRRGVGSAMLKDLDLLYRVLSMMRAKVNGRLSAKIRAGFDQSDHVLAIGEAVQSAGVDYIVVHPRRRVDFYQGVADWRTIRLLREALGIPVVGNGDCWYASDALRMRRETGCAAVMIGRPALRNPWIFQQIEALEMGTQPVHPSGDDLLALILEIVERYDRAFPKNAGPPIGKLKELLGYLGRAVADGGVFRKAALRATSIDEILEFGRTALTGLGPEGLDLDAHGRLGLETSGRAE